MKPLYLIAVSSLALTAAACGPKTPVARVALDCPTNQGDLTRTSASPDGKACTYVTSGGAEVTLQLVSVTGGVDSTLERIETTLLANRVKPEANAKSEEGATPAKETNTTVHEDIRKEVDKTVAEATADARESGVKVEVGKDGATTVVTEDGGTTTVNLPGIHIVANDDDESAHVQIGPLKVNASGDEKQFVVRAGPSSVRLRGEALNPEKRGFRASFLYKGDDLPDGYRFVGYHAGGPKVGPITVAVVKSRSTSDDMDGDDLYSDVKKLVRRNGGV